MTEDSLSEFKTQLKTFLFRQAFSQTEVYHSCKIDYVHVYVYISMRMISASAVSFCFAKRFALYNYYKK